MPSPKPAAKKPRRGMTIEEIAEQPRMPWTDDERLTIYVEVYEDMHKKAALDGDYKGQIDALKASFDILKWRLESKMKPGIMPNPNDGEAEPDLSTVTDLDELRKLAGDNPKG